MKTELKSLRFYSILSDGSTDSGNIEEELVYVTYLSKGKRKFLFCLLKMLKMLTLTELKNVLNLAALKYFDIDDFQDHLVRFNVDRTAVNVGLNGGGRNTIKRKISMAACDSLF